MEADVLEADRKRRRIALPGDEERRAVSEPLDDPDELPKSNFDVISSDEEGGNEQQPNHDKSDSEDEVDSQVVEDMIKRDRELSRIRRTLEQMEDDINRVSRVTHETKSKVLASPLKGASASGRTKRVSQPPSSLAAPQLPSAPSSARGATPPPAHPPSPPPPPPPPLPPPTKFSQQQQQIIKLRVVLPSGESTVFKCFKHHTFSKIIDNLEAKYSKKVRLQNQDQVLDPGDVISSASLEEGDQIDVVFL